MPADWPFSPCGQNGTVGLAVELTANATPTSVPGTLDCTSILATSLLVTNLGTVAVYVRMGADTPLPVATNKDVVLPAGIGRLFTNPKPQGKVGIAVLSSTTVSAKVHVDPGIGGLV